MLRRLLLYSAAISFFASAIPCLAQTQGHRDACSAYRKEVVISKTYYIDEVRFEGDTRLPKSELEAITARLSSQSWVAEDSAAERVAENARREWQDRGYFRAEVKASTEQLSHDPTSEHLAVILQVNAGRQYKTGKIRLAISDDEPPAFPLDELRRMIPLQSGELFETSRLREGYENLRKRYGAWGFVFFNSQPEYDADDEQGVVNLLLRLDQGRQYRVGKVAIHGFDEKVESELRSLMPVDDIYNDTKVRKFLAGNPHLPPQVYSTVSPFWLSDPPSVIINFQGCSE